MPTLSLGAENDTIFDIMRKHLSPALVGRGWDALLHALSVGDQYKADLAKAAFEQLFKSTAGGVYLDRVLADDGVTRPPGIGIGDEPFRALGITTTARKLLIQVILEVLETYYGSEATRAFATSGTSEPFALTDGDELFVEIDGQRTIRVVFDEAGFTTIGSATALEVSTAITRTLRTFRSNAYAEAFQDPESGDSFVRIFSGSLGLTGSVRILGGRARSETLFFSRLASSLPALPDLQKLERHGTSHPETEQMESTQVGFVLRGRVVLIPISRRCSRMTTPTSTGQSVRSAPTVAPSRY
jgi:hypothetical protein